MPLTVGSTYQFEFNPVTKDGVTWDVTAATCTFIFRRPDGTSFTRTGTGAVGIATYVSLTTDLNLPGQWYVALQVTLGSIVEVTPPNIFFVEPSP